MYDLSLISQQLVRGCFLFKPSQPESIDPSDVCLSSLHIQQSHLVMSPEKLPPLCSPVQFNRMDTSKREYSSLLYEDSSLTNMR